MLDNLHELPPRDNLTVEEALGDMSRKDLKCILMIGLSPDNEIVIRGSKMQRQEALWLAELLRIHALEPHLARYSVP